MRGEFRPDGVERAQWCDDDVLRQLRRRSLATLRREVEPVEQDALARFLPAWHGIPAQRRGLEALVESITALQGAAIVGSTLESEVLPARVLGYRSADLDELCTSGDLVWLGAGAIGAGDGRVRLYFRDQLALLASAVDAGPRPEGAVHEALRAHLAERGASFWQQLRARRRASPMPRSSPRSGTSCGPVRSRTTPCRPCARCSAGQGGGAPPQRGRGRSVRSDGPGPGV